MSDKPYASILDHMAQAVRSAMRYLGQEFLSASDGETATDLGICAKENKAKLSDFVTRLDLESERLIQTALSTTHPDIPFVGEESGGDLSGPRFFLVDPLDGTKNAMALRDSFAVSAAYVEHGEVKAGVIGDPVRGHLIRASINEGAWLETKDGAARQLDVRSVSYPLNQVQFSAEIAFTSLEDAALLTRVMPHVATLRKSGSSVWDSMRIAQGRPEALIASGLEPHDLAAALIILRESGAVVTNTEGVPATLRTRHVFSATPQIHAALLPHVKGYAP